MEKYWLIALLAIFELALFIEAAPRSLNAEQIGNLSTIANIEPPVRYDGAQLWSVDFSDDRTKLVVINLKKHFGLYKFRFPILSFEYNCGQKILFL